jgi:hypothetical protein
VLPSRRGSRERPGGLGDTWGGAGVLLWILGVGQDGAFGRGSPATPLATGTTQRIHNSVVVVFEKTSTQRSGFYAYSVDLASTFTSTTERTGLNFRQLYNELLLKFMLVCLLPDLIRQANAENSLALALYSCKLHE